MKISGGRRVETVSRTLWIGDRLAFQRFRRAEKKDAKRGDAGRAVNAAMFMDEIEKSPASDLYSAMREVAADRSIASVGGFVSIISNRDPDFGTLFIRTCCSIGRMARRLISFWI